MPLVDLGTNIWPIRPSDLGWRYGSVGLLSGFLLTPVIGLGLGAAVAVASAHRGALRTFGFLSGLGGVALLLVTIMFTMDVIQLRGQVPPEGMSSYRIGAIRAVGKNLVVAVAMVWLSVGALRGARALSE